MPRAVPGNRRRHELADRRKRLGYTQRSLGERLGTSADTVAGWERGSYEPLPGYRARLAAALDLDLAQLDRLIDPDATPLVVNGHRVPTWLSHYESLVEAAGWLCEVEAVTIPSLLQTPAFAAVVERSTERLLADHEVGERVELRQARQRALHRTIDPLHLTVVLPQHLLCADIGHPEVMADQLDYLLGEAERPNVEIRVLGGDSQLGFVNGFQLLTKPDQSCPFMAVTADLEGPNYVEDPDRIAKFVLRFEHLVSQALSLAASVEYIYRIRESYR